MMTQTRKTWTAMPRPAATWAVRTVAMMGRFHRSTPPRSGIHSRRSDGTLGNPRISDVPPITRLTRARDHGRELGDLTLDGRSTHNCPP